MRFLVLSAILATTLVGCGQSEQEKNDRRVRHHNNLADTLNARVPTTDWTNAQLAQYEHDLNELESVDRGLNAGVIAQRRQQLVVIRAIKSVQARGAQMNSSLAQARAASADVDKVVAQTVLRTYDRSVEAFEKEYLNNPDTTVTDVPAALKALDNLLDLNTQVQKLSTLSADEKAQFAEARKSLEAMRERIGKPTEEKKSE